MDIIMLRENLRDSLEMMEKICRKFDNYRVVFITDNAEEFNEYIQYHTYDVVIMEECFLNDCEEVFKYKVHRICLVKKRMPVSKFFNVILEDDLALMNHLAKLLIQNRIDNDKIKLAIRHELERLGYNYSLTGTGYLEDAINLLYVKNSKCNLEREVFPQLSRAYKKSAHSIKVNIQNSTNAMISANGYEKALNNLGIDNYYGVGTKAVVYAIVNKLNTEYNS